MSQVQIDLREHFDNEVAHIKDGIWANINQPVRQVIQVTELPSGALETAINTEGLQEKLDYISKNYDEQFRLKHNPAVRIVGWLIV